MESETFRIEGLIIKKQIKKTPKSNFYFLFFFFFESITDRMILSPPHQHEEQCCDVSDTSPGAERHVDKGKGDPSRLTEERAARFIADCIRDNNVKTM